MSKDNNCEFYLVDTKKLVKLIRSKINGDEIKALRVFGRCNPQWPEFRFLVSIEDEKEREDDTLKYFRLTSGNCKEEFGVAIVKEEIPFLCKGYSDDSYFAAYFVPLVIQCLEILMVPFLEKVLLLNYYKRKSIKKSFVHI